MPSLRHISCVSCAGLLALASWPALAQPGRAAGGALKPGRYVCSMSAAGGQFPLTIGDGVYTDRAGKRGTFSIQGDRIAFTSGSLAGQYSRVLGPGKFGLSSSFNGMFYGVCNLK